MEGERPRLNAAERDATGAYLQSIGKVALLDAATEVELAKQIEAGLLAEKLLDPNSGVESSVEASEVDLRTIKREGEAAKQHMFEANLRLVVSIVRRSTSGIQQLDFLERIQEGNLGLVHAVEKFDYQKGYKFSTYATWWIRQALDRTAADIGTTIRIPTHRSDEIRKLRLRRLAFQETHERLPTDEELASELACSVERVETLKHHERLQQTLSLDISLTAERDGPTLAAIVESTDDAEEAALNQLSLEEAHQALERALLTLAARDAQIVRMRFGLDDGQPRSLESIAGVIGVTRERIRQILHRAIKRLRDNVKLRDFFEEL